MKKSLFLLCFLTSLFSVSAQDEIKTVVVDVAKNVSNSEIPAASEDSVVWKFPGVTGLNFSQTAFKNWAEGGQNSISLQAFVNLNANYKKGKVRWDNNLSAEYGTLYSAAYSRFTTRKSSDKLALSSKFGYQASKSWYYTVLADFKTQMDKGYDYGDGDTTRTMNSKFLAPGYLIASLGMDYIPSKYVSVYLSPVTGRFIFVRDTTLSEKYGVDAGEKCKVEAGAYMRVVNDFDIVKNVHLNSKLELFSAYETFGNVVVNWELLLAMKVTKYLNASVRTHVKYDDAVKNIVVDENGVEKQEGPKIQFMDVISVGFAYNF